MEVGGDITGKTIVPIVKRPDGTEVVEFAGAEETPKAEEEHEGLLKKIRNNEYYPYLTTPEEFEKLQDDKKLVDELFSKVIIIS